MSYQKLLQEDRRLVLLRLLMESDHYSANEHLLRAALDRFGHNVGRDLLRSEFAWLKEQGLVTIHDAADVQVVKLTGRGHDVADGRSVVPGVKRPEPGE